MNTNVMTYTKTDLFYACSSWTFFSQTGQAKKSKLPCPTELTYTNLAIISVSSLSNKMLVG